ncbi:hypothetical protein PIB30_042613 [Stylosanthes scabra]|uniref:Uncharacterized protein n=1 Tax=Stylosanthes scabra TaxID=79078 RepID=A0ABU6XD18_9FABA|nr:hypothetical protein [Stylosanthes scabra]
MRGKESAHIEMIEAMARGWAKMLKEDVIQKDEEKELKESFCADQKSQKKGPDKTYEKPPAEYPSMTPRKHKTPQMPTRFSRRLAALKARQTRDEAGPWNAAPRGDEIINISSDSEQVQENVQEEGGEIEEEEDIPYDGPEDGEMEEEEEDPEEDPEEELEQEQEEGQDWVEEDEIEEEENDEEEDVPDLHPGIPDYDEYFHDYFKLAPPPSPASDEESDDE